MVVGLGCLALPGAVMAAEVPTVPMDHQLANHQLGGLVVVPATAMPAEAKPGWSEPPMQRIGPATETSAAEANVRPDPIAAAADVH